MTETGEDRLRAMIRMIAPARALKEDLEKSLVMENFEGTGDAALKTVQALQASIARLTDDPFVQSLTTTARPEAPDNEKVALARLSAGQILAYLGGQTGLVVTGGGGDDSNRNNVTNIKRAGTEVNIEIDKVETSMTPDAIAKIIRGAIAEGGSTEGQEKKETGQ